MVIAGCWLAVAGRRKLNESIDSLAAAIDKTAGLTDRCHKKYGPIHLGPGPGCR